MKLTEKDKKELNEIVCMYGANRVTAALCESDYWWSGGNSSGSIAGMHSPGTSKAWNGKKGLIKSIPSLLFTSVLSLPLACILALGAVNARLRQKWESKTGWSNQLLNPNNFFEWIATGNYISNGRASSTSPKRTEEPVHGDDKRQDPLQGEKKADPMKKLSEFESGCFTVYWISLSNGEVLKYRAPNEAFAKLYANAYITNAAYEKYKKAGSLQLQNCSYYPYECIFDDGQVLQCAARTKEDAAKSARDSVKKLTDASNEYNSGSFVTLPNMEVPKLTEVNRLDVQEFAMPDTANIRISTSRPAARRRRQQSALLYDSGPFEEYKILIPVASRGFSLHLHVPAPDADTACKIAKRYSEHALLKYAELIFDMGPAHDNTEDVWIVTTGDHDRYVVPVKADEETAEIVKSLQELKIKAVGDIFRETSGQLNDEFCDLVRNNAALFQPESYKVKEKVEKFELLQEVKLKKEFCMTVSKCITDTEHTDSPVMKFKIRVP